MPSGPLPGASHLLEGALGFLPLHPSLDFQNERTARPSPSAAMGAQATIPLRDALSPAEGSGHSLTWHSGPGTAPCHPCWAEWLRAELLGQNDAKQALCDFGKVTLKSPGPVSFGRKAVKTGEM